MLNSRSRRQSLDILRGLAILLVMGRHLLWLPPTGGFSVQLFAAWRHFGWIGVDLFFVLSGFLVGGLLIQEVKQYGSIQPISFLIRRAFKIYPSFYVFLILSLWVARLAHVSFPTWPRGLLAEIFFLQSYLPSLWPQTWSLAVEEHFYLLLVGLFLVMLRPKKVSSDPFSGLPFFVLAVNSILLMGRLYSGYVKDVHWSVLLIQTHWRLDSLLFGVLLGYIYHYHEGLLAQCYHALFPWRLLFLPLLIGPCLVLDLESNRYVYTAGLTGLYLGFGWIVLDALLREKSPRTRFAPIGSLLSWIGRHSYSIYLWHVTVYYVLVSWIRYQWPHMPLAAETVTYLAVAILVGSTMSVIVEQPFLAWRDRLIPSRSRPVTP